MLLVAPCSPGARGGCAPCGCALQAPAAPATLLSFLDKTATVCGRRLLRTNVLQPLRDIPSLEMRLDSLQVAGEGGQRQSRGGQQPGRNGP